MIDEKKLIEDFRKIHTSFNGTPMEESDHLISLRSVSRVIDKQPKIGEWIPCSKRLPEETGEYLCTVEWYGSSNKENLILSNIEIPICVMVVHFLASNKSFKEYINFCNYKVIAWRSLPDAYVEK